MKCDVCASEATVFLTQIINGQMTTVNLCDACSKAKGVTDETGFGLAEAFLSGGIPETPNASEAVCPTCGFTASQLKKIGRMGCPDCYSTFREGLDNLLKAMHKGTRHVGKIPAKWQATAPESSHERLDEETPPLSEKKNPSVSESEESGPSLAKLKKELENAVREERYEEAAIIKREIDRIQETDQA
jgi:protein arginine kinase activator